MPPLDALLAGVLDRFPNGSVNIFDADLRYLYAGGEGLAAAGLSPEMLIGKRLHDLFTPESVLVVEPFYRRALAGESVRFDLLVFERVYSISAAPYGFEGDTITSIIAVAQDITDAKRPAAALAESEARLHLALDVAQISTWELDVSTGALQMSESVGHLLGVPLEKFPRSLAEFLEVVHPEDRDLLESRLVNIGSGWRYAADFRIVRTDGQVRWLMVRAETSLDDEDQASRMLGALIDVTVQHESQEKLRRIYRSKDDLLAVLGHELRQPVQAAVVALGVMEARTSQEAGQRARRVLERQVLQMSRLGDELLDVARVVRSEAPLQRSTFDLIESIHAAVETTTFAGFGARHDIRLSLPSECVPIHADQQRIQQVLLNLVGNAVKYTPDGGTIDVQLIGGVEDVLLRVVDSGRGMDPAHLPNIFELFTRLFASGERDVSGLGVGLAVVKRIVEQHGGEVWAHSDGPGRGAEFVVRLPR